MSLVHFSNDEDRTNKASIRINPSEFRIDDQDFRLHIRIELDDDAYNLMPILRFKKARNADDSRMHGVYDFLCNAMRRHPDAGYTIHSRPDRSGSLGKTSDREFETLGDAAVSRIKGGAARAAKINARVAQIMNDVATDYAAACAEVERIQTEMALTSWGILALEFDPSVPPHCLTDHQQNIFKFCAKKLRETQ